MNNEKGAALIELCLAIPLMLLILSLLELTEQGWTFRIRNRMMSQYSAVTSFRGNEVTIHSLKQRFNLDGTPVSLLDGQTTQITLSPYLLNSRIKLKQTTYISKSPQGAQRPFSPQGAQRPFSRKGWISRAAPHVASRSE